MKHPVDILAKPLEIWSRRESTEEERTALLEQGTPLIYALEVNDELLERISTHAEAACWALTHHSNNALDRHIDTSLRASEEHRKLLAMMPANTPDALDIYQREFGGHDDQATNDAINKHGVLLAEGQLLFHGGCWPNESDTFATDRPFSTSFCPDVAKKNAFWKGKAYAAGRLDLMLVRVTNQQTKAYAYSLDGDNGHEKEIVFASGAQLKRTKETCVGECLVGGTPSPCGVPTEKIVPTYLIEVELS